MGVRVWSGGFTAKINSHFAPPTLGAAGCGRLQRWTDLQIVSQAINF